MARTGFYVQTKDKEIQSHALEIVERYRQGCTYTFGQALCQCMEETKTTIATLSARTGISERQIGRMRTDEAKEIGFRTIIGICVALKLTRDTAEKLLNFKRYTLNCNELYAELCKLFLDKDITVSECNVLLEALHLEPLTYGEIWE